MLGAALLVILIGCFTPTKPSFELTLEDPMMTTDEMEEELGRLHEVNLTVRTDECDSKIYPLFVDVDFRNVKTLVNKFIRWDACPEVGLVFLLYKNVADEEPCHDVNGSPLIFPEPIPGEY